MDDHEYMTYEEFGRKFFEIAVTEERVGGAIADIAGDAFEMGPMGQGPGKIAKVTAKVRILEPRVTRQVGEKITFAIRIPSRSNSSSTCGSTSRGSRCSARLRYEPPHGPPSRCC